jgi:hypothetical protein
MSQRGMVTIRSSNGVRMLSEFRVITLRSDEDSYESKVVRYRYLKEATTFLRSVEVLSEDAKTVRHNCYEACGDYFSLIQVHVGRILPFSLPEVYRYMYSIGKYPSPLGGGYQMM